MAIDAQQPPIQHVSAEHRKVFARQNIFGGIYRPPQDDLINVNVYQDIAYANIESSSQLLLTTGVNIVLDHVFEFGLFCSYMPGQIIGKNVSALNSTFYFNQYFYCGDMFAYVPLANRDFHPKIYLDLALGNAHGISVANDTRVISPASSVFMVIKPAVALEMNFWWFLQWTAAVQYRFQVHIGGTSEVMSGRASGIEISTGPVFQF